MKNELQKWFLYFVGATLLFIITYSIFGPKAKQINLQEIAFTSTNSSELYFKNMRSYFYDKEEREDARFMLYRIGSRNDALSFILVNNWLMDESYIIVESKYDNFSVEWHYENETGIVKLDGENNRAHYVFAAELFEQLDRKADLWLLNSATKIPFSEEEKASLLTTLKDYFKLVGKLR
ncbi:hypothetical protein N9J85_00560 [bacterium]|jgi:hypothetical protein|nr:hypothetical protein [bacterium]